LSASETTPGVVFSRTLGLYLHIPFCQSICGYCNFNRGLLGPALKARYVGALEREIRAAGTGEPVPGSGSGAADTIFFGGGTPSLLDPDEIERLITACRETYTIAPGAEITLETNPETATSARLEAFRRAGVTRVSVGVQSFDDAELQRLGRLHSAARAVEAVTDALGTGFDSVSLDLMFWLPGQSRASWRRTVEHAIALGPPHLSLYLLELYPNAPLKESMARAADLAAHPAADAARAVWAQAPDDEAADMYLEAFEALDEAGYAQYEISNIARAGHSSRHNVKYWQMGSWRGFGCGAHSTVDGVRWQNVASTVEYADRIAEGRPVAQAARRQSDRERIEEALFTGLRLSAGIDRTQFRATYGVDPWTPYEAALAPCLAEGLMWMRDGCFGLTRQGMLVANEILATFV
jgi:oxygen-independent coproporphyrinogen-3 oxidase